MTKYLIDETQLDLEQSQAISQRLLNWAAGRADAFTLRVDPAVYADPTQYRAIAALGILTNLETDHCQLITGVKPAPDFVRLVTAPLDAAAPVSGDLVCVDDIELSKQGIRFYAMFDYGRTQLLDVTQEEVAEVLSVLADDAKALAPAPRTYGA